MVQIFLSQFFVTFITAFIVTLEELVVSDGFSEIKVEVGRGRYVFLIRKKLLKLSLKLLAKIRFPISSKCKSSRKRLDVGMLLLSM